MYTYPDLLVICGKPQRAESDRDSVTNPTLIVEILSPTTRNYDRGDKFAHYRKIATLREYLLFAQDRVYLEHHTLQPGGGWLLRETSAEEDVVSLESIGVKLVLKEAYAGVEFEPEES